MFNLHKCKCDKIDEIKVYNTKEVMDLHKKVMDASSEMDFFNGMNLKKVSIKKHHDRFTIQMNKNNFSLYLIPIVINHKTYQFVIDTGAQISGIVSKHSTLINQYKLENKIPIKSASGKIKELSMICLNHFYLGTLEIENQPFVVLDEDDFKLRFMNKEIIHFDGVIGWDILSQIDFELDTKKNRFSLLASEEKFTYCNLINVEFPVIITYDEFNKAAIFGIDTGAKDSWINDEYALNHNLKVVKEARGLNVGVHGIETMKIKLIKECIVSFFESKITLLNIRSGQTQVFMSLSLDGIFGNEIFKNKNIQFLNSKGIVRII